MRINQEIKSFIHKKVEEKAAARFEEIKRRNESVKAEHANAERQLKNLGKKLVRCANAKLNETARKMGFKIDKETTELINLNTYQIGYLSLVKESKANEQEKELLRRVSEVAEELIVKLAIGADYDSIVKEINNIKFN